MDQKCCALYLSKGLNSLFAGAVNLPLMPLPADVSLEAGTEDVFISADNGVSVAMGVVLPLPALVAGEEGASVFFNVEGESKEGVETSLQGYRNGAWEEVASGLSTNNSPVFMEAMDMGMPAGTKMQVVAYTKSGVSVGVSSLAYATITKAVQTYMALSCDTDAAWNDGYRYGFNGVTRDDGIRGVGNSYEFKYRGYDTRLARFYAVDPLASKYPHYSTYQFAGNTPIKYIELEGLEPANNPKDATSQDDRDPSVTVNNIYKKSGGDNAYQDNYHKYMKGSYSIETTISGVSNKPGYTSDSKDGASKYNLWVNSKGAFYAEDYNGDFSTVEFSNFLLGNMIYGTGPENIIFPLNGKVSSYMRDAGIVKDAMNSWYDANIGRSNFTTTKTEVSGNLSMPGAALVGGIFHPESLVGSATVHIRPINNREVLVTIFNVMSLTSGDLRKIWPGNHSVGSVVRDPALGIGANENRYGNTSQTFQFTLPIYNSILR